jgi:DNA primase
MLKPLFLILAGLFFIVGTALDRFRIILNPPEDMAGHVLSFVKRQLGEAALKKVNYALGALFLALGVYGLLNLPPR